MILYVENPEDPLPPKKPIRTSKQIQQSCRIQNRHTKISCISITNNEQSKKEIKTTVPVTIASRRVKYFGVSLTKEVKDQYTKNYKTLLKETKEDTNKWKGIMCPCIERQYC